ncbi:MFS transporter [Nonomuraea sp. NPDC004186]
MTLTRSAPAPTAPHAAGTVAVAACAAALLALVNYTVPMVTLSQAAADLGSGPTGPAWMLNSISLGLSALLLVAGGLADDHGRRRAYVAGTWALAAGALLAALSVNTAMFVVARLVQGGASAAMLAGSLGMLGHAYPGGPDRVRVTGRYGAMLGLGIALGPLLSGSIAAAWSWRGVHVLVAVAGAVLAVAAGRVLPESRSDRRRPHDLPGAITLALGTAALLAGVTEGRLGWNRPVVYASFAAAVVLLAAFTLIENRRREPLIELGLLRRPLFLVATSGAFVTGIAVIGMMSYLPTVLQVTRSLTPLTSAVLFSLWSGMSFLASLLARHLRVHSGVRLALGLLLSAAGALLTLGVADAAPWTRVVAGLVVGGVGSGLINASLTHLAIESVPLARASMGSGANNTARYVGSSLGVAAMATTIGSLGWQHGTDVTTIAYAAIAALAAALTLTLGRSRT